MEKILEYLSGHKLIITIILLSVFIIWKLFKKVALKKRNIVAGEKLSGLSKIHVVDNTILKIIEMEYTDNQILIRFRLFAKTNSPKRDLLKEVHAKRGYEKAVEKLLKEAVWKVLAKGSSLGNEVIIQNDPSKVSYYVAKIKVFSLRRH